MISTLKLKGIKWKFSWKLPGELHRKCVFIIADSYGTSRIHARENESEEIKAVFRMDTLNYLIGMIIFCVSDEWTWLTLFTTLFSWNIKRSGK